MMIGGRLSLSLFRVKGKNIRRELKLDHVNIYLDIDGVLLTKEKLPANYVSEFLTYLVNNHSVYWLTTHCKGDSTTPIIYLSQYFDKKSLDLAKQIKPTSWRTAKTEAIDFNHQFRWFDDYLFDFEKRELMRHDLLENWIRVDLDENPDQLLLFFSQIHKE